MQYKITPLVLSLFLFSSVIQAQPTVNMQAFMPSDTTEEIGYFSAGTFTGAASVKSITPVNDNLPQETTSVAAAPDAPASPEDRDVPVMKPFYPVGMMHCAAVPTPINDVVNPVTGQVWMDRNLGAVRDAADSYDPYSFGDLYQWGRFADGHQCRVSSVKKTDPPRRSAVTERRATTDNGFAKFIIPQSNTFDWSAEEDPSYWQGTSLDNNNPCPYGYRLPTEAELRAEMESWASADAAGAINSPLKWPLAGFRYSKDGEVYDSGALGSYWSSTIDGTSARYLFFDEAHADIATYFKANGHSVRCIKD